MSGSEFRPTPLTKEERLIRRIAELEIEICKFQIMQTRLVKCLEKFSPLREQTQTDYLERNTLLKEVGVR